MGIVKRVEALLHLDSVTDENAQHLMDALYLLAGGEEGQMGERYKVLSIFKPNPQSSAAIARWTPPGFSNNETENVSTADADAASA